jgi:uncharacterized membrane protein
MFRNLYIVTVVVIVVGFFSFEKLPYLVAALWAIASIVLGVIVVVEGWRRFFSLSKQGQRADQASSDEL